MELKDYFEKQDYIDYLIEHCHPEKDQTIGRVAGTNFATQFIDHLKIAPGERLLEIGCGLGRIMRLIKKEYQADVWGCDISKPVIEEAKKIMPSLSDKFFVSPGHKIEIESNFMDYAVLWGVFEMTDQRLTMVELSRVIKVGGKILFGALKNKSYLPDDTEALAAHRAYIQKEIPIYFSDIDSFEKMINYLGFEVEKTFVFTYKQDVSNEKYKIYEGIIPKEPFSDMYCIIRKVTNTPLDYFSQYKPSDINGR